MSAAEKFIATCRKEREQYPLPPVAPVRVKPMVRPLFVYDACIHEFERLNAAALREWYELTKRSYPAGPSYPEFLAIQHETACAIEEAAREDDYERPQAGWISHRMSREEI